MSQHPNDDLRRLAQLLSTTAAQLLELADELSPEEAEVYAVQLESASRAFGESLDTAKGLTEIWVHPHYRPPVSS